MSNTLRPGDASVDRVIIASGNGLSLVASCHFLTQCSLIVNIMKPGYIFPGHCPENITSTHASAYCRKSLGAALIHTKIKAVECYAKITMKMHVNLRSQIHKRHVLVDLKRINAYAKSPLRTILYQLTGDVPLI